MFSSDNPFFSSTLVPNFQEEKSFTNPQFNFQWDTVLNFDSSLSVSENPQIPSEQLNFDSVFFGNNFEISPSSLLEVTQKSNLFTNCSSSSQTNSPSISSTSLIQTNTQLFTTSGDPNAYINALLQESRRKRKIDQMTQGPNDSSASSKHQKLIELNPTSSTTALSKSIAQQPQPKEKLILIENYVEKIVQPYDPFVSPPSQPQLDNANQIKQFLNNLCDVSTRESVEEREPSPTLTLTLRSYQKQALTWMINRELPYTLNNVSSFFFSPHLFHVCLSQKETHR